MMGRGSLRGKLGQRVEGGKDLVWVDAVAYADLIRSAVSHAVGFNLDASLGGPSPTKESANVRDHVLTLAVCPSSPSFPSLARLSISSFPILSSSLHQTKPLHPLTCFLPRRLSCLPASDTVFQHPHPRSQNRPLHRHPHLFVLFRLASQPPRWEEDLRKVPQGFSLWRLRRLLPL
jgi:hypothetical protein